MRRGAICSTRLRHRMPQKVEEWVVTHFCADVHVCCRLTLLPLKNPKSFNKPRQQSSNRSLLWHESHVLLS